MPLPLFEMHSGKISNCWIFSVIPFAHEFGNSLE